MTPSALGPVLAGVRGRSQEYRDWWAHQPEPELTPPWSDADEERIAALESLDPWWLRSVADELERVRRDVRDVGAALAEIAEAAIGGPAAAMCARLAASTHERAGEAGTLAVTLRDSGDKVDEALDGVVRRLARAIDERSDDWFETYSAVLRTVRAEVAAAVEQLPALLGGHPDEPPHGPATGWTSNSGRGWRPEPGMGPLLPDTEARRIEPGYGIRIARLPDGV